MLDATDEFARQLKATQGIDFRIRAGINSGPVMVGNVGSDLRYEYTALGDAVNVAARMQTAAEPGTIVITEMTRRLTGDTFDLDDLGEIEVKGKTEPIHAFRVIGRKAAPARRRGLESVGLDSPMVGRAEQLERLTSLLDIIAAGRGRAAFIVGEPGIGKSRLLAELKMPPSPTVDHPLVRGPLRLVRAQLALPPAHRPAPVDPRLLVLRDGVGGARRSTPPSSTSWAWTRPRPRTPRCTSPTCSDCPCGRGGDPDRSAGRTPEPLHRGDAPAPARAAARRPVVVVCEDIHWADPASIDVARQLMPLAGQLPILFVAAMRAETDAPGWALIGHARELFGEALTEIQLEPLTEADSKTLVANLLEIEIAARARARPDPREVGRQPILRRRGRPNAHRARRDRAGRHALGRHRGRRLDRDPGDAARAAAGGIDQLPDDAKRSLRVRR